MNETHAPRAPEIKAAGDTLDLKDAFGEFMTTFEAFKDSNDERLAQLEGRFGADVLTSDKVDRISRALDEQKRTLDSLSLKRVRPALGRDGNRAGPSEHKDAFDLYMRSGDDRQLRALDSKAMSYGSGQDGGYLVPAETETEIGRRLSAFSPIRSIASVRQVSAAGAEEAVHRHRSGRRLGGGDGLAAADGNADAGRTAVSDDGTLCHAGGDSGTAALLEDSVVDLDQWIASEVEAAFAEQEGTAFVSGNGTNKPKGFLDYNKVAEASWAWGDIGYIVTGVSGALPASSPSDVLIDTVYTLKAGYRQNANWVMNRKTQASIRKLKDADGSYLWQPPAAPGQRAMLMGFPLVEAEDMPDAAANATPIAFGDFSRGYLIVDRTGVRVLRDPYSAKPYVLFYTTKRVGGGVQDFSAIKLLKYGTA